MFAALWLAAALAGEGEVGTVHPFGVGVSAGFPASATFRWLWRPNVGLGVHLGPTFVATGLHTRIQVEQQVRRLRTWDVAELSLTWHGGVLVNYVFGQATAQQPLRLGIYAGLGAELRLDPVPVAAFVEVAPVLYPLDLMRGSSFLPAGVNLVAGARWYFGSRKKPIRETNEPEHALPLPPPTADSTLLLPEPLPPPPADEPTAHEPASPSAPPTEAP